MVPSILNDSTAFWLDFEGSGLPETSKINKKMRLEISCFFNNEKRFPGPVFSDFGVSFGISFGVSFGARGPFWGQFWSPGLQKNVT